nr:hypothetical protein OH826_03295 [Streptomyces sp. NBC_00899]WSX80975.1 hypothetical protein OH826_48215 [Streptomyces sp. NBC_00899]
MAAGKGGGRRAGRGEDLAAALDDLYGTPPPGFVARREELAARAKAAGRAEDARRLHRARRPTLGAWAANLLVRSRQQESRQFLELGRALRDAHRTLDGDQLKELSAQQWRVISALSRQAAQLAEQAGRRLPESAQREVESTLRAVLADPDAAERWSTGRLETALTPPAGLPSADAPQAAPTRGPAAPAAAADDLAERRRRRHRDQVARARKEAKAAEQAVRDHRKEQTAAGRALQAARDRREQAQHQAAAVEEQLRQARQVLRDADQEQREAEDHQQAAAETLTRAERDAQAAAVKVDRLDSPG